MKIKTKKMSYDDVMALPYRKHKKPEKPSKIIKRIAVALSKKELEDVNFHYTDNIGDVILPDEPCLVLMNHSSFIDLKIAETIFKDRDLQIVCTSDGFVGKEWLMRKVGCIPTQKFVTDFTLVKDMKYCVEKLKTSILLFPEASYSFDGTATPLPESIGKLVKMLGVPVVMISTHGAFLRDPLYNGLRLRKTDVSAESNIVISADDTKTMPEQEINSIINTYFSFDHFKEQSDKEIEITEDFRTLGLERVLYKCPCCNTEGLMKGTGISINCGCCGALYEMDKYGKIHLKKQNEEYDEDFKLSHIPDWYRWERECVREEIENGTYSLDIPVEIKILKDFNAIYEVGEGRLKHGTDGFELTGCEGKLNYSQSVKASYSLYADYFWYELGDMICIGDNKTLYYCFPKSDEVVVAKARLAAEELYKYMSNN